MKKLRLTRSLLVYLDELEFTEAALAADPDAAELANDFQEAIRQWDEIFAKERKARRQVVRGGAVMSVRDATLDRATRKFAALALVEANQDRMSTAFRRFFPKAPSILTRWSLRKECEHILNIIVPELEKSPDGTLLKPFAETLKNAAQDALAALDERNKRKAEKSIASIEVDEWKEDINRLRLATYAELLRIAAEKRFDSSWAEAFFRTSSAAAPDAEVEIDEPESDVANPEPGPAPTSPPETE